MSAADRERVWERGTELAERSLAVLHGDEDGRTASPRRVAAAVADRTLGAAVHFWAAVHWGLWGETKGSMAAVHKGIAKRIRDHALIAIALDETFERGGPRRLLGRLHAVAPRVPLFTGWVSRTEGSSTSSARSRSRRRTSPIASTWPRPVSSSSPRTATRPYARSRP